MSKTLSRRHMISTLAAAPVAGAVIAGCKTHTEDAQVNKGSEANPLSNRRVVDMTHTLDMNFPTYFGTSQFDIITTNTIAEHTYNLKRIEVVEHTGTHVDAPYHFSEDQPSIDEIPPEDLIAPLCTIDISERASENPDTQVTPDDVKSWIATFGEIPERACVAMNSGWSSKIKTDQYRNFYDGQQHYPGFHVEAMQMLIEETHARSVAVDTLSLDFGISQDFIAHKVWLATGRFGIENIANLEKVPQSGATLFIGASKHRGGTGGSARILALV